MILLAAMILSPRIQTRWVAIALAIAGFWLSCTALIDFLIMPSMYVSGMMRDPGFAAMGYTLFWAFNRVELLCAAGIVTALLALRHRQSAFEVSQCGSQSRWAIALGALLISLTLLDTYGLTPQMSALAFGSVPEHVPASMTWMHGAYWLAEGLKLGGLAMLARLCIPDLQPTSSPAIAG